MVSKILGRSLTENEIQNSILEWLRYKGITAWRNNSMGVYDPKTGRHRSLPKYARKGVSDILGILDGGRFMAIEVKKDAKSKPSKDQRDFIDAINDSGGLAFVAFSVDCVLAKLEPKGWKPVKVDL